MNVYGELVRAQVEVLSADPAATLVARIFWNSTSLQLKYTDGSLIRPLLANDQKCVIGNNGTASTNVRFNRGGVGILELLTADQATAEGSSNSAGWAKFNAKLGGSLFDTYGDFTQVATPATPPASTMRLYGKSDGYLYTLDSSGAERKVGSGSSGVNYFAANPDIESGTTGFSVLSEGDTTTITNASPAVFTAANAHSMAVGQPLYLSTTGGLPTGLATGTVYYVSNVPSSTTFRVSASLGGVDINTSSAGSGVHTFRPSVPVTGARTFIASTATIAASSSTALRGSKNLLFTPGTIGDYFVYTITPDAADTAKMLQLSFDYTFTTGSGSVDGDFQVYLYDVGNSQLIQPAPYKVLASTKPSTFTCQFQTPGANLSTIRVIVMESNFNNGYVSARFDNFQCGPVTRVYGAPISDWTSYSMTIGAVTTPPTKGTTTIDEARWRRVGDSMEISYNYKAGAGSAGAGTGAYLFPLPSGYTIDTAKLSVAGTGTVNVSTVGPAALGYASNQYGAYMYAANSTNLGMVFYNDIANPTSFASTTTPNFTNTSVQFSYTARVPITGWSSNVLMSADTDTRVCAAKYNTSTQTIGTSFAALNCTTKEIDTHAAYSSGIFTVPVGGIYRVSFQSMGSAVTASAVDTFFRASLNKNGSQISQFGAFVYQVTAVSLNPVLSGSTLISVNAGDTLEVDVNRDANVTSFALTSGTDKNWVSFERLTGPSAIAASESVNARYTGATATVTGALSAVTYTTKDYDTHNAFSAGTYTIPASGKYSITALIFLTAASAAAGNAVEFQILKNGSATTDISPVYQSAQVFFPMTLTDTISCVAGDTITFKVASGATTPSISASSSRNVFSISRVGN